MRLLPCAAAGYHATKHMARKHKKKQSKPHSESHNLITFVAGCGREQRAPNDTAELAYTLLEFSDCSDCQHRISPEGTREEAGDFCVWRPANTPHPFATLASWEE